MKARTAQRFVRQCCSALVLWHICCCVSPVHASSDNASAAIDLSGCWDVTGGCFPETPYTVLVEQHGGAVALAATAGNPSSCNGTLTGNQLTLSCIDDQDFGAPYPLVGTVLSETSLRMTPAGENAAEDNCLLNKHDGLDPLVETMLVGVNRAEAVKPLGQRTPRQMRRYLRRSNAWSQFYPAAPIAGIVTRWAPGPNGAIPLRVYVPQGQGPFPVIVFYHGGGWVVGSARQFDHFSRLLAAIAGALVFSVDYRLAPEHVFPAAHDDAYAALEWVAEKAHAFGGDPARLAVAGESAGGSLAAWVCRNAAEQNGPAIQYQVLMCPITNVYDMNTASYVQFATGYMLTREWMQSFRSYYLPDTADWSDERVSPLLYNVPEGLPPAFVITAAFDVLRDEGEDYARRLAAAGVPVRHYRAAGMIHGFTTALVDFVPQARAMVSLIAVELEGVFQ